jgi:Polyketide cyclase / dehydrase and lipid transport
MVNNKHVFENSSARIGVPGGPVRVTVGLGVHEPMKLEQPMNRVYFSSTLDHSVDEVWGLVRDFNNYPRYIEGVSESSIEDGKPGDEVGVVRRFCYLGHWIRQRLTAHSDADCSFTYAGMDPFPFPAQDGATAVPAPVEYEGTLRLRPIIDRDQTFIEWFVVFDSPARDAAQWHGLLVRLIQEWVASLRRALALGA